MNLLDHPDLADRLAAAYALGTLRGGARRRFEAQARQSPTLRAAALAWQERFSAITELQHPQQPDPNVWKRIENLVSADAAATAAPAANEKTPPKWWRGWAVGASLASVAMLGLSVYLGSELASRDTRIAQLDRSRTALSQERAQLVSQLQATPEIRYFAVLSDDKSSASALVTFDPKHNTLTLKRLGGFQEGPEKSLQLWTVPPGGGPRSLGVLTGEPVIKLAAAENQVKNPHVLAISLEPKGGVPSDGGPTGPVLFKGPMLPAP
jgi:anti-sigma-K factor RskA